MKKTYCCFIGLVITLTLLSCVPKRELKLEADRDKAELDAYVKLMDTGKIDPKQELDLDREMIRAEQQKAQARVNMINGVVAPKPVAQTTTTK